MSPFSDTASPPAADKERRTAAARYVLCIVPSHSQSGAEGVLSTSQRLASRLTYEPEDRLLWPSPYQSCIECSVSERQNERKVQKGEESSPRYAQTLSVISDRRHKESDFYQRF